MTLDHKTSHKGHFFKIEIYTSPEGWINKLSIDVWFKAVQIKSLAMHITNQKLSFDIHYIAKIIGSPPSNEQVWLL